jgi:hypothetical protein
MSAPPTGPDAVNGAGRDALRVAGTADATRASRSA